MDQVSLDVGGRRLIYLNMDFEILVTIELLFIPF